MSVDFAPVTVRQLTEALGALGVTAGDTVIVHSSLKSFGALDNGPETVVTAFEQVLGRDGTLVMPTLCQVDFQNAYRTWYRDKPSDVGYLTEYFRKLPYVYRSDHPTHSVAARGRLAYELTKEHTAYGPHLCPFGNMAFADSSPWMKALAHGAKVVMLGVPLTYSTVKHVAEGLFMEELIASIDDEALREDLTAHLRVYETFFDGGVWPFVENELICAEMDRRGLVRHAHCGCADLLCVTAQDEVDVTLDLLRHDPEPILQREESLDALHWIQKCRAAADAVPGDRR